MQEIETYRNVQQGNMAWQHYFTKDRGCAIKVSNGNN